MKGLSKKNSLGEVLLDAVRRNDVQKVQQILDANRNTNLVNYQNFKNYSALMVAALRGRDQIVRILLREPRIDTDLQCNDLKMKAQDLAGYAGHTTTVKLLAQHGTMMKPPRSQLSHFSSSFRKPAPAEQQPEQYNNAKASLI